MKKIIKIGLILIGLILIVIVCFALFINMKGIPSYEKEPFTFNSSPTPDKIARGKKLGMMLCAGCHKNMETGKLTGKQMLDGPPEFGMIYAPNITQDKDYGIAHYTDSDIAYLLRTGIKKDGKYAPPYMAKLPNLADDDLDAIISWLRSDDPMVTAASVPDKPCEPSFLTKMLSNIAFKPLPLPEKTIELPDTTNQVELGRYIVVNLDCYTCHSADFKTINFLEPEMTPGYLGGGNVPLNLKGEVMLTSNITFDEATGVGNWTKEQFIKAVKTGIMEGEDALRYPMMPYTQLTDYEAGAIYEYIKTIAPINNDVKRSGLE